MYIRESLCGFDRKCCAEAANCPEITGRREHHRLGGVFTFRQAILAPILLQASPLGRIYSQTERQNPCNCERPHHYGIKAILTSSDRPGGFLADRTAIPTEAAKLARSCLTARCLPRSSRPPALWDRPDSENLQPFSEAMHGRKPS